MNIQNLAQFKKALTSGMQISITNHIRPEASRETHIVRIQSNSFTTDANGKESWIDFPKATRFKAKGGNSVQFFTPNNDLFLTITIKENQTS